MTHPEHVASVWERLTAALDELDGVRAQLREARGHERTSRFYDLLRARQVGVEHAGHVANVIELSGGWCLVHWPHDPQSVGLYTNLLMLRHALCADGVYLLSLVDTSEVSPRHHLTLAPRQRQMVRLLGEGKSNKEIAREMGTALSTVKNSMARLYRDLDVRSRTEACLLARDLNLDVDPEPVEPVVPVVAHRPAGDRFEAEGPNSRLGPNLNDPFRRRHTGETT